MPNEFLSNVNWKQITLNQAAPIILVLIAFHDDDYYDDDDNDDSCSVA